MVQSIMLALVIATLASVITIGIGVLSMQDKINALVTQVQGISNSVESLAAAWTAFKTNNPGVDVSSLESAVNELSSKVGSFPTP